MTHRIIFILAAWTLAAPVHAQKLSPEEEKEGFISLFNGRDFSGWRVNDSASKADNWKVENGVIKLSGGGKPHLASKGVIQLDEGYGLEELQAEWSKLTKVSWEVVEKRSGVVSALRIDSRPPASSFGPSIAMIRRCRRKGVGSRFGFANRLPTPFPDNALSRSDSLGDAFLLGKKRAGSS